MNKLAVLKRISEDCWSESEQEYSFTIFVLEVEGGLYFENLEEAEAMYEWYKEAGHEPDEVYGVCLEFETIGELVHKVLEFANNSGLQDVTEYVD